MKPSIIITCMLILMSQVLNSQSFPTTTVQNNGDINKRINYVYLADGYTSAELATFDSDVVQINNDLFSQVPFSNYVNFFNCYGLKVPSIESGADHPGTGDSDPNSQPIQTVNTYFNSTFDYLGIHRLLYPRNSSDIYDVLGSNLPQYDQAIIVVNSPYYGGSGGQFATNSTHSDASELAIHEIGHSFAGLGDEYAGGCSERPNLTTQVNPNLVKWANWIGDEGIGVYAIGNGCYRPHQNCKMRYLNVPFCAVCREAFIDEIYSLVSPIDAYSPAAAAQTYLGSPLTFDLDVIYPIPSTLEIEWLLNGGLHASNTETISLNSADLTPGLNTLTTKVIDTTALSRSYLPNRGYEFTVSWTIDNQPLAIDLLDFYGFANNDNTNDINWKTASERNNDHFNLEHSTDGLHFSSLTKIAGKGDFAFSSSYHFKHTTPFPGINYYRLKQTDFDGKNTYSEVIHIQNETENDFIGKLYPNPMVSNKLNFDYHLIQGKDLNMRISNIYGQFIYESQFQLSPGNQTVSFELENLSPGYYMCELSTPGITMSQAFIKSE